MPALAVRAIASIPDAESFLKGIFEKCPFNDFMVLSDGFAGSCKSWMQGFGSQIRCTCWVQMVSNYSWVEVQHVPVLYERDGRGART